MLEDFLQNTCNITRKIETNDNWIVKKTTQNIYSNIKCQIYAVSSWLNLTNIWENTPNNNWSIILEPNKTNIKLWDIIEITDSHFWTIGKYQIVKPPKMNEFTWWEDSIQLEAKSI